MSDLELNRRSLLKHTGGLVTLVATGQLLASCGSDDDVAGGEANGATVTTVTAWGNHPEWQDVLEEITAAFEAGHGNINVDWQFRPNANYQAAVNTALAGGQAPDIFGWLEGTSIREGAGNGSILDLTGKVDLSQMTAPARAQVEFDGKTWGCPLGAYSVGVFYQRQIFSDNGLEIPQTWDDLIAISGALSDQGITPWVMPAKDMILPYFFYMLSTSSVLGSDGFAELLAGDRSFTDPDLLAAAQLIKDLQPYFNEGFEAQDYAEGKAAFAQERAAMIIGGSADFAGYQQANPNVDVGVFGFPSPDGNRAVTTSGMDLNYTVWSDSDNAEAAAEFIGWFVSEECQQIVADKLAIPIRQGISPSGDTETARIAREMIEAGQPDIPLLLDTPEGGGTLGAVAENSGIFSGSVSVDDFAAAVQESMIV
jgi:raffinose/stachyose/melibiose transport system substrate-binding protein